MITQTHSAGRRFLIVVLVLIIAGAAAALGAWLGRQPPAEWHSAVLYPQPRPIAPFTLQGTHGPLTRDDLTGQWDLLFFGFTHCPDICPATLSLLNQATEALASRGLGPPRVTLVSVDPERDSPEQLASYVRFFDPQFRGATGSPAALTALARDLGVAFYVSEHEPGDTGYTVDHSASVLVVDPEARLVGLLRPPLDVDGLVADLARLLKD